MKIFIQNEAGSAIKNRHNEKTLEWLSREPVSRPYPYPYGFVIGTTAEDGGNVDCFVLTREPLGMGQIVECDAIGLMEQIEDGENDHNVLAALSGEKSEITSDVRQTLTEFVMNVFSHVDGKRMMVGAFMGWREAEEYIRARKD